MFILLLISFTLLTTFCNLITFSSFISSNVEYDKSAILGSSFNNFLKLSYDSKTISTKSSSVGFITSPQSEK